ncbi:hypothetical protein [Mesorhizobium sp. M0809]|uniref:hypothetical protein n=1 Tax=Mesorhizobium sp. M0809 TaxID=2957003 RepID=UPI00333AA9E9
MADGKIPIIGQIAEVNRELALRRNVFPIRVRDKKMKQAEADLCMRRMEAVLATLMFCQAQEAEIRAFIAAKSEKSGGGGHHEQRSSASADFRPFGGR